ncbi:MAG: ethylbenzene dehydrogenase-related protein [Fidelibacterota bacterium]
MLTQTAGADRSQMKRHHRTLSYTLAVTLVLAGVYFAVLYRMIYLKWEKIETKDNLTVAHVGKEFDLDPHAPFWNGIEPEKIRLYPQSARSPYGNEEKDIWVRAAYNGKEVAFLLEFNDKTEDLGPPVNPDACAIMFALAEAPATAQMMGYGDKANVWQWLADRNVERYLKGNTSTNPVRELTAHGPGTQTPMARQNVEGKGDYRDGKWSVMFKRRLDSNQGEEFEFEPGTSLNVAFALWDGGRMESFSRKSIAILRKLSWEKP